MYRFIKSKLTNGLMLLALDIPKKLIVSKKRKNCFLTCLMYFWSKTETEISSL